MEWLIENLFISILNMSITASYVALFVMLVRLALKKAPKIFSYSLWATVLFRMLCPVTIPSRFSFLGLFRAGKTEYIPSNIGLMQHPQVNIGIGSVSRTINSSLPAATPYASVNPMQIIVFVCSTLWVLGVLALILYSIVSYLMLKRKVRTAMLVADNVFECEHICSPFVLGLITPKIYLPIGLSESEKSYILLHEQTHIRRLDYLIKPLAFLALTIHWFNPLMWMAFVLMSKDMEMSCDESVLSRLGAEIKKDYSSSLLSFAVDRKMLGGSPLAFGESNIKSRIKNALSYKRPVFWAVIIAVIVVVCIVIGLITNPISYNDSMKWAKSLKVKDVQSIEIISYPNIDDDLYQNVDNEQFKDIVKMLNNINGKLVNPQVMEGSQVYLYITTKDGICHTVANNGYLIIDGDYYDVGDSWSQINFPPWTKGDPVPQGFWERVENPILLEIKPTILFNDMFYELSSAKFDVDPAKLVKIGKVESIVEQLRLPTENNQANHSIMGAVIYGSGDNLIVEWNGNYILYELLPRLESQDYEAITTELAAYPQDYTAKDAEEDGVFCIVQGKLQSDQSMMDNFIAKSGAGKPATITIVQYNTEGDPIFTKVIYDGTSYYGVENDSRDAFRGDGAKYTKFQFEYLKAFDHDGYEDVYLLNDNTITIEQINKSLISSQSTDWLELFFLLSINKL